MYNIMSVCWIDVPCYNTNCVGLSLLLFSRTAAAQQQSVYTWYIIRGCYKMVTGVTTGQLSYWFALAAGSVDATNRQVNTFTNFHIPFHTWCILAPEPGTRSRDWFQCVSNPMHPWIQIHQSNLSACFCLRRHDYLFVPRYEIIATAADVTSSHPRNVNF